MPIFTRRRLQSMLDDLSHVIGDEKGRDLLRRLEDKRVEQALPAEMELALLWSLSQIGEVWVEPEWFGDDRPDAYSETLVAGRPAIIEIAATHDNVLSGEKAMDNIARQISICASAARKGVGDFLYFSFNSESRYENGEYFRRRLAPDDYMLSDAASTHIQQWIKSGANHQAPLHICENGLDVVIERKAHRQIRYHNIWSSMPPETHSLTDNPLYSLLRRKLRQVRTANSDVIRLIILADVGSTLLKDIGTPWEVDRTLRRVSAREIISHFLSQHCDRIDGVAVFTPSRKHRGFGQSILRWKVSLFNKPGCDLLPPEALKPIAASLPNPRFEGYQVRSLFRQGAFSPKARGWYRGMMMTGKPNEIEITVSARVLMDLLAGRIDPEQFRLFIGHRPDEPNLFSRWLDQGMTLSNIKISKRDVDSDDDSLVIRLSDDPSAREFRLKEIE